MTEANEVSDKGIMAATNVERQDSSGRIRFTTALPDGSPLNSEWIQESDKTKGVLLWCEAVRQAIVNAGQEQEAQRKRRAQAARAARPPSLVDSSGAPIAPAPSSTISTFPAATTGSPTSAASFSTSDPVSFVTGMVAQAEANSARWEAEALRAGQEWRKALEDLKKWRHLRDSLVPATTPTTAGVIVETQVTDGEEE